MRILLIEDTPDIAFAISMRLEDEGYSVTVARDGIEGEALAAAAAHDLIILDINLPGMDGFSVLRSIRESGNNLPVVVITARYQIADKVGLLDLGADDYLVKPFSTPEFIARVRALLRRAKPEVLSSVLKVGDIVLDRETHRVHRGDTEIRLGPTEFRLLEFMMRHPGRVFSRSQLLDNVWGETIYIDERTVDVHVGRLRKAVNRDGETDIIRTIRGAGYAMQEG